MLVVTATDDLRSRLGQELGVSDWHRVTQEEVSLGFHPLPLAPHLMGQVISLRSFASAANHGLQRVRFLAPVPVGSEVRLRVSLEGMTSSNASSDVTLLLAFEGRDHRRPACFAEVVIRVLDRA